MNAQSISWLDVYRHHSPYDKRDYVEKSLVHLNLRSDLFELIMSAVLTSSATMDHQEAKQTFILNASEVI